MMGLTVESINAVIVKVVFKSFFRSYDRISNSVNDYWKFDLLKLFKSFELKALLVESNAELFIFQFLY